MTQRSRDIYSETCV